MWEPLCGPNAAWWLKTKLFKNKQETQLEIAYCNIAPPNDFSPHRQKKNQSLLQIPHHESFLKLFKMSPKHFPLLNRNNITVRTKSEPIHTSRSIVKPLPTLSSCNFLRQSVPKLFFLFIVLFSYLKNEKILLLIGIT